MVRNVRPEVSTPHVFPVRVLYFEGRPTDGPLVSARSASALAYETLADPTSIFPIGETIQVTVGKGATELPEARQHGCGARKHLTAFNPSEPAVCGSQRLCGSGIGMTDCRESACAEIVNAKGTTGMFCCIQLGRERVSTGDREASVKLDRLEIDGCE